MIAHPALAVTAHRSEPLPARPWFMAMQWHDLLLLHWPVAAAALQPLLPPPLEVEQRDGSAWLGIVPLLMRGVRLRGLPPLPGSGAFPELNVRTYVRHQGVPGIWFFSLDAGSPLAVRAARALFRLPYFDARMRCERRGGHVHFGSERTHRGAPPAAFAASWPPPPAFAPTVPGTLPHWFAERYRMYVRTRDGGVRTGHVHHAPWQLAATTVLVDCCDMTRVCGQALAGPPAIVHAAAPLAVIAWLPVAT